ncbi:MAG: AAA family ATPase [Clostridia bacterium]|nr:AAA family ATPase [Clostridia bacterium]
MKIKSIQIKEYKSICTPQKIEFGKGGIITFIGKNGSGKTNLLKALNAVFQVNADKYYYGDRNLKYSVILELTNATLKELPSAMGFDSQHRTIEVYNDGYKNNTDDIKINVIRSDNYADALKDAASAVKAQANELSSKTLDFKKMLDKIKLEYGGRFYELKDVKNSETCQPYFDFYYYGRVKRFANEIDTLIKSICHNEEEIDLNGFDSYSYDALPVAEFPEPDFYLSYRDLTLSEFDKQFIVTLEREKIISIIEEFNRHISELSSDLKAEVSKLNQLIETFNTLLNHSREQDERDYLATEKQIKKKENILAKVRKALARTCYYIPATEQLFAKNHDYDYEFDSYNYDFLLTKTYITLKYEGEERNKILSEYEKVRNIGKVLNKLGINEAKFAADFEEKLNESLPAFERDMISKIEVQYQNGLKLYVVEKNQTKIPFANTSLGRRWYFAYYFIKNCLKQDDVLILDEPGIFLHPQAQAELLCDLENLAEHNTVILCTHSPYMISKKYNNIHVVRMSNNGTAVSHFNRKNLDKMVNDAGMVNTLAVNDIILNPQKELVICEGVSDIACLNAFMDYFHVDKSNYKFITLGGFNNAKFLIEFYLNLESHLDNHIKVRMLLDKDAREKILNKEISVPKTISKDGKTLIGGVSKEYLTLIFAGSDSENGRQDIEGLFIDNDSEIYLETVEIKNKKCKKVRMDIGDILPKQRCNEQTERKFKELFQKLDIPVD